MFFSFDGLDGTGKSTQLNRFVQWLGDRGHDVVPCRDPGSTPLGEQIRSLLLTHDPEMGIDATSEMFLYMAARAQLVDDVIAPALDEGKTIVSDRFLLANVVYQGYAAGMDVDALWRIGAIATRGRMPHLTFVLDLPVAEADRRVAGDPDRMERRSVAYRERLRNGFLHEARRCPDTIVVIDAARSVEAVHAAVVDAARRLLDAAEP